MRAVDSEVAHDAESAPIATTDLVSKVFRSHHLSAAGSELGDGFSPFSMHCGHHAPAAALRQQVLETQMAESGNNITPDEAKRIAATNALVTADPFEASEKLAAFSVAIDVYFGINHRLSVSIRTMVGTVRGPMNRIRSSQADTDAKAQQLACMILYEVQQDVFHWIRLVNATTSLADANRVEAPDFKLVMTAVQSNRIEGRLAELPKNWDKYLMPEQPSPVPPVVKGAGAGDRGSNTIEYYGRAEPDIMARFKKGGYQKISDMHKEGVAYPKHGNIDVCLKWAVTGKCSSKCARKAAHKHYGIETNKNIHKYLDEVGCPKLG